MFDEKILAKLKNSIVYNPVKGTFRRMSGKTEVYMKPNATGAPRILVNGKEHSARSLAWYLMTGEYPGKFDIKSLDGDLNNLIWENLTRAREGHKFCPKCKEEKPHSEYSTNSSRKAGYEAVCKQCKRPWNATYNRKGSLKKFGLTVEQYEDMYKTQGCGCAICGGLDKDKRLAVDHCHTTGKVRGLLCEKCNRGIGIFGDNPVLLSTAAEYLSS